MSIQYKHKKTGQILVNSGEGDCFTLKDRVRVMIPLSFIEDSCDWEKIEEEFNRFVTRDQVVINDPYSCVYTCTEDGKYPDIRLAKYQKGSNLVAFSTSTARDAYIKLFNPPKVILTTEDGVDITGPNKTLNCVDTKGWSIWDILTKSYNNISYSTVKLFSTPQARDKYIEYNKPTISIGELSAFLTDITMVCNPNSRALREMEAVLKTAINKAKSKL